MLKRPNDVEMNCPLTAHQPTNALILASIRTDRIKNELISQRFQQAIQSELREQDGLTTSAPDRFVITMSATSESDALSLARLLRTAFQQATDASEHNTLAIGVVLFGHQSFSDVEITKAAQQLVDIAHEPSQINIGMLDFQATSIRRYN